MKLYHKVVPVLWPLMLLLVVNAYAGEHQSYDLTLAVKSISYVPASARIFGCGVLGHGDYRAPNCQQQVEVCHITATLDNSDTIYEFARPVVNSITNHQPSCVVEVGKAYPARWWKTQRGIYVQSTSIDKRGNVRHGDMDFELKGARMQ